MANGNKVNNSQGKASLVPTIKSEKKLLPNVTGNSNNDARDENVEENQQESNNRKSSASSRNNTKVTRRHMNKFVFQLCYAYILKRKLKIVNPSCCKF